MNSLLVACLCLIVAKTGYSIKCYQCEGCNDEKKLKDSQLMGCHPSLTTCGKTTTERRVVRFCSQYNLTGCEYTAIMNQGLCVCKEDACNGAETVKSNIIVGSIIILLIAKFIIV
ncbi:uncharacterized protein LOC144427123 [Styela clava]